MFSGLFSGSLDAPLLPPGDGAAPRTREFLLLAHALTKLGSKAWEFSVPLLLLQFSPGDLGAPTAFGLAIFLVKFALGPAAGAWMDRTARGRVVLTGIALQCAGVAAGLLVYGVLCLAAVPSAALLVVMVGCGVLEALGALVSSVAVKKDWVPTVWAAGSATVTSVNTWMSNIDLCAEIFGPLGAGVLMSLYGYGWTFVAVGAANVASFGVELYLLLRVLASNDSLREPRPPPPEGAGTNKCAQLFSAWPAFVGAPGGVPLLVASYALLWFTVLSPHGVVLTAYLQTRHLSPAALSLFRGAGALSGVAGMGCFRVAADRLSTRRACFGHLWVLAAAVLGAAAAYAVGGVGGAPAPGSHHAALSAPTLAFLGLIVVSRFGLYGFDVGLLQLEQENVDVIDRAKVGAVESSLCSLGTMAIFVGSLGVSQGVVSFGAVVYVSAAFVAAGALAFTAWCLLWHEHTHTHGPGHDVHPHTTQQRKALDGGAKTHTHVHFHAPWRHAPHSSHQHSPHVHH